MGVFSTAHKSPAAVQAPQCSSDLLRHETGGMRKITSTVNQLNQRTFEALNLARNLKNDRSLTPFQHQQAAAAKAVLKARYEQTKGLAGELVFFNKTFDKVANQLVKARDALAKGGALLIDKERLVTREGYTVPWLQHEVVRHRGFVVDVGRDGIDDVQKSLIQLNLLCDTKGLPRVKGVSESWRNAMAL